MSKKRARKGAFWHVLKIKITSRKPATNKALQIISRSRNPLTGSKGFPRRYGEDPTALTQLGVVACRREIAATDVQSGSYSMKSL